MIWFGLHLSGIHTTIAGVIVGLFIPNSSKMLDGIVKILHPLVALVIIPIFALSTCTVDFKTLNFTVISNPITMGVFLGLFLGKQVGVTIFSWVAIKFKIAIFSDYRINMIY